MNVSLYCDRVVAFLIATANKDLYDFSPSPLSSRYYGVAELRNLFLACGFSCEFFGYTPVDALSWRQRILRPIKAIAVKLHIFPTTAEWKRMLKRLVFGSLVPMPAEINENTIASTKPVALPPGRPDHKFKVIYLAATKNSTLSARYCQEEIRSKDSITIIVPCYNEEHFIGGCLTGVLAFKCPQGVQLEILVVDGGSTDGTIPIVSEFIHRDPRIRLVKKPRPIPVICDEYWDTDIASDMDNAP